MIFLGSLLGDSVLVRTTEKEVEVDEGRTRKEGREEEEGEIKRGPVLFEDSLHYPSAFDVSINEDATAFEQAEDREGEEDKDGEEYYPEGYEDEEDGEERIAVKREKEPDDGEEEPPAKRIKLEHNPGTPSFQLPFSPN